MSSIGSLGLAAGTVGLLCLFRALLRLYQNQRQLIFPITRLSKNEFTEAVHKLPQTEVSVFAPFDALVLSPDPPISVLGTAVWFHGNSGTALDRSRFAQVFIKRGYRLVLAEYPGYGVRDGVPTEGHLVDDALALVCALRAKYTEPLTVVGESIGTGVAVQVAAALIKKPVHLVLLTPFVSLVEVAQRMFPWAPVKLLMKDRFESGRHLSNFRGTVSVLVAGQDDVLGAQQGRAMAALAHARGHTSLIEIPAAVHNNWADMLTEDQWSTLLGARPLGAV